MSSLGGSALKKVAPPFFVELISPLLVRVSMMSYVVVRLMSARFAIVEAGCAPRRIKWVYTSASFSENPIFLSFSKIISVVG